MTDLWKFLAGTGTFYGGSGGSSDDDDLPTIEEILYPVLQKGFTTKDSSLENTVRGIEKVALEERGGSVDHSRSASGNDSVGSLGKRAYYFCCKTDSNFF